MLLLVHTHPSGFRMPSGIDDNMLVGWAKAFGVPVICIIVTDSGARAYLYMQYNKEIIRLGIGKVQDDYVLRTIIKASYSEDDRYLWEIKLAKDLKSRVQLNVEYLYVFKLNKN